MSATELPQPDLFHLRAAIGWLELGNPTEAGEEIARISPVVLEHPGVLEVRWQICAATQSWDAALALAEQLITVAPKEPAGWLHRAYALRRAKNGGVQKAWDALLPAAKLFPKDRLIPFNLACYAAQLARFDEAFDWFQRSSKSADDFEIMKQMALADRDLEPIWERIRAL